MITPDEKQIMFAEYWEAKGQILNLHNRITKQIADEVKIELTPDEERILAESRTADPDAIAAYLKGVDYWEKLTPEDWEKGERAFKRSLELKPGDARCRMYYAHLLMILNRPDEAVTQAKLGLELDPLNPLILGLFAVVMLNEGDYQSAIVHVEKALSINPDFLFAKSNLLGTYLAARGYESWIELWKELVCWEEEIIKEVEETLYEHGFVTAIEKLLELNETYGNPGCQMDPTDKLRWYLQLNDFEKALDMIERLYEISFKGLPYFATNMYNYDQLKVYPRYVEFLKKMNLPLPEDQ